MNKKAELLIIIKNILNSISFLFRVCSWRWLYCVERFNATSMSVTQERFAQSSIEGMIKYVLPYLLIYQKAWNNSLQHSHFQKLFECLINSARYYWKILVNCLKIYLMKHAEQEFIKALSFHMHPWYQVAGKEHFHHHIND